MLTQTLFARNPRQFVLIMSRHLYLDSSPPPYHGPHDVLDKSAFRKSLAVLGVRVSPEKTRVLLKASELKKCALLNYASGSRNEPFWI